MSFAGTQLGHYHLLRLIGQGGMGEVYLAQDSRINRQVAIKVLRTEPWSAYNTASQQEAARLFQREAQAIAMLDHPAILPLFDYGEEQINGTQVTYLVMPYRSEGTLKDWLLRRSSTSTASSTPVSATPLSLQDVAALISQAASALQYAHNNNIIHQDVKPSNFLIRSNSDHPSRPDILLADFGIARFVNATTQLSHGPHGTPAYMAPEQWEGNPVPASDQYALAVMAYELLTGTLPFHGGMGQLMYSHHYRTPPPPRQYNPSLPPDVDHILLTALAKQPGNRFASISAFANALQQAALTTSPNPPPTPHTSTTSSTAATPAPTLLFTAQQQSSAGHSFHSAPTSPETYSSSPSSPHTERPEYSATPTPRTLPSDSSLPYPAPSLTPPHPQPEKLTAPTFTTP
ncbi:MAG: serine/threonine protein kinase, partial [Ktedonobacteraceae bacterium]|nr:serine/threonine protein kinase [Ktedonobacteraceae bacterium]